MKTVQVTAIALDKELRQLIDGIVDEFQGERTRKWGWGELSRSNVIEFFLLKGLRAFIEEEGLKEGEVPADVKQQ